MIRSMFIKSLVALSVIIFSNFTVKNVNPYFTGNDQLIELPAGTSVSLQLNENVSSEEVEVGNTVEFTVRSSVIVNGKVLIAAGSIAEGWIKDVEKTCETCNEDHCAKLVITVENVQAVDGQRINLRSIPHTVKGKCCCGGGPAVAKIGTVVSAKVLNNVKIDA